MADQIRLINQFSMDSVASDANSAVKGGVYGVSPSTQNVPVTVVAGLLVVFRRGDDKYLAQFFMDLFNTKLYYRTADYGNWKSWKEII